MTYQDLAHTTKGNARWWPARPCAEIHCGHVQTDIHRDLLDQGDPVNVVVRHFNRA